MSHEAIFKRAQKHHRDNPGTPIRVTEVEARQVIARLCAGARLRDETLSEDAEFALWRSGQKQIRLFGELMLPT